MPVDSTLCSWGLLRGQVKERRVEFTEGDTGPYGVAFTAMLGKCQRTRRMNGWPLGANTDHLVDHDKLGSFMKKNTALLKSTHIKEATRKPKCIGDAWQEGSVLPSSFRLFRRVVLIFLSIFCGRWACNCLEAYNKNSSKPLGIEIRVCRIQN